MELGTVSFLYQLQPTLPLGYRPLATFCPAVDVCVRKKVQLPFQPKPKSRRAGQPKHPVEIQAFSCAHGGFWFLPGAASSSPPGLLPLPRWPRVIGTRLCKWNRRRWARPLAVQESGEQAAWEVPGVCGRELPDTAGEGAEEGRHPLDLLFVNGEGLVGDATLGGRLGLSNHEKSLCLTGFVPLCVPSFVPVLGSCCPGLCSWHS